jgi:UMF1 family MFS transporter
MTPKKKSAEFFGFFDVSQKFSGILGPLVFGVIGQIAGSSRLGIIVLVVFFLGGMYILSKVNIEQGIKAATDADNSEN